MIIINYYRYLSYDLFGELKEIFMKQLNFLFVEHLLYPYSKPSHCSSTKFLILNSSFGVSCIDSKRENAMYCIIYGMSKMLAILWIMKFQYLRILTCIHLSIQNYPLNSKLYILSRYSCLHILLPITISNTPRKLQKLYNFWPDFFWSWWKNKIHIQL